jgi:threonine synthase
MPEIHCQDCGAPYPDDSLPYRCPRCGGLWDYSDDFTFIPPAVAEKRTGLWRFHKSIDLPEGAAQISLGEGATPLIWSDHAGIPIGLKLESLNPTGSYKDRGSAVLVSQMVRRGIGQAVEDSSGNAGASFAAYAARARLNARVYVPESASGPKRNQIEAYGAELRPIPGPRSAAAEAVLADVQRGIAYASHAYLPFGLAGIATIAYELWESNQAASPGTVIAPAGHGGLLLGLLRGFKAIQKAGYSERIPYLVGVQSAACDPLTRAYQHGLVAMETATEEPTLAEGVRVRYPVRAGALVHELDRQQSAFISVNEGDILEAYTAMNHQGVYIEPTSAIAWAALKFLQLEKLPQPIVVVLSGFGLKYMKI